MKAKQEAVRFLRSAGIMDEKENCLSENYRTDMNSTELIAAAKKAMEKELERCIERGTQPSFYTMFLEGYAQGFNEGRDVTINKAFDWMIDHVNLIGSPIELKQEFKKYMCGKTK